MKIRRRLCSSKLSCILAVLLLVFVALTVYILSTLFACLPPHCGHSGKILEAKRSFIMNYSLTEKLFGLSQQQVISSNKLSQLSQNSLQAGKEENGAQFERKILNHLPNDINRAQIRSIYNHSDNALQTTATDKQIIVQSIASSLNNVEPHSMLEKDELNQKAVEPLRRIQPTQISVQTAQQTTQKAVQPVQQTTQKAVQPKQVPPMPQPQNTAHHSRKPARKAPPRKPSKHKSKKSSFRLPDGYPLFRTAFPAAVAGEQDGKHSCTDSMCSELLSPVDLEQYKYCLGHLLYSKAMSETHRKPIHGRCRFMSGQGRAAVALVSFPGSGNTWVRGLLERATGICTGSIYCDNGLRGGGFNGERITSGSVLVVKTHRTTPVSWTERDKPIPDSSVYGSAILIVRNPFNALVSEWTRESAKFIPPENKTNSHVNQALGRMYFGEYKAWNSFVHKKIGSWQLYFSTWLLGRKGHNMLVVRYEDLKEDSLSEVKRMLDFLEMPYSEEELKHRLEQDFTTFKRKHHETFDHFTAEQKSLIRSEIQKASQKLKEFVDGGTMSLEEYIQGPS